jgi:hypothetical protein
MPLVLKVKEEYKCTWVDCEKRDKRVDMKGANSPKRSGGDLRRNFAAKHFSEERGLPMKWQAKQIYWKVALILGAIASLAMAAGADPKW